MEDVGRILRERLGPDAAKVPTRRLPNFVVRAAALFDPGLRPGHRRPRQADDLLRREGQAPARLETRPVEESVVDCAQSLLEHGVVARQAA